MEKTARSIISLLQKAGYKAYLAGGSVRDMIMEEQFVPKPSQDYDIATDAKPEDIEAILPKTYSVGKNFGVILAVVNGFHFEIATFRSDSGNTDGRRPDAIYYSSPKEDARRRDFTINALFYDPVEEKLYDFVGGEKDIEAKLIRFVGNPDVRIKEDHLRILRAVRFKNEFNFQYHPETYQALKKYAHLVSYISADRIREELSKMLKNTSPRSSVFEDMFDLGILQHILPEITNLKGVAQPYAYHQEGDVYEHTMRSIDSCTKNTNLDVLYAVLFHDIGKAETFKVEDRIRFDGHVSLSGEMTDIILLRLNFSRKKRQKIVWLVKHHMLMGALLTMPIGRKRRWFLDEWFKDLLQVFKADIAGSTPTDYSMYNNVMALYRETMANLPKKLPKLVSGNEVMKHLNIPQGEKLGKIMDAIETAQLEGTISSKEDVWKFLDAYTI